MGPLALALPPRLEGPPGNRMPAAPSRATNDRVRLLAGRGLKSRQGLKNRNTPGRAGHWVKTSRCALMTSVYCRVPRIA